MSQKTVNPVNLASVCCSFTETRGVSAEAERSYTNTCCCAASASWTVLPGSHATCTEPPQGNVIAVA